MSFNRYAKANAASGESGDFSAPAKTENSVVVSSNDNIYQEEKV